MALDLVLTLVLLLANGFFVATEFALARVRPTQVQEWLAAGRPGAKSVRHGVEHIDAYLAACQLGITIASLGLGVIGESFFHGLLEPVFGEAASVVGVGVAGAIAFAIVTVLHVVIGELSPKSVAISRTGPTVLIVAPLMRAFYFLTKPLVDLFNGMGNLLLKPFGIPPAREAGHVPHSEAELHALVRQSGEGGVLERAEQRVTEAALAFDERRVREVMRPRPDVVLLTTQDTVRVAADRALETGYTRLPLCEPDGGLDAAVGVVNVKDLLRAALQGEERALRDLARPVMRVSESLLLSELLATLQEARQHVALVTDEHGTVIGLVTMENLLEQLVGDIDDEFDPSGDEPLRRDGDAMLVSGSAPLRDVLEELGIEPEDDLHEATIGGHLLERLGRMPQPGDVVQLDGHRAEVREVGGGRVRGVRLTAASGARSVGAEPNAEPDQPPTAT
jgi:CBS domain containing-hemolysin-like protein